MVGYLLFACISCFQMDNRRAPAKAADQLIRLVYESFPQTEYYRTVDIEVRSYSTGPEEEEAKKVFFGRNWKDVPVGVLRSFCPYPFLIGPNKNRVGMSRIQTLACNPTRSYECLH